MPPASTGHGEATPVVAAGPVDCNTLLAGRQQMLQELDAMDTEVEVRLTRMREARDEQAKLDATAELVELLATQRKQMRDRMMRMDHQTLQFMLTQKGEDVTASCPQLSQQLRHGTMPGHPVAPSATDHNNLEAPAPQAGSEDSGSDAMPPPDDNGNDGSKGQDRPKQ
jgi:hypothetical protein